MTEHIAIPCSFMRGGTSKGLFFRWEMLPADAEDRDRFLCAAIGSPDPYGRQLDGMGGGISSLSKAMMVRRSQRAGIDVDYLFAQIAVDKPTVDYASNCGNLSAAVGAFAVDQGLVQLPEGPGTVRMFNENTAKRVDCHLQVRNGRAAIDGDHAIAGVAGPGAEIRLDFIDPGGSRTTTVLPRGEAAGEVSLNDRVFRVSFIDAAIPCVFVDARALGLTGCELPAELSARQDVIETLEQIRSFAGRDWDASAHPHPVFCGAESAPKVALVAPPGDAVLLTGQTQASSECDVQVRMISMGKPHLAIPLTGALCTAVAARIPGTVVSDAARLTPSGHPIRIGTASGVVPALADVDVAPQIPKARSASVFRTARLLMEGQVHGSL